MRIVSIIGHKKSGKTALIEELIPVLSSRGHRIGTVKHAPHTPLHADPTADSARHRRAGAERTLLVAEDGAALLIDPEDDIEEAISEGFPGFDIVLVEGYKDGPFPKIEVQKKGEEPLYKNRNVICLISDDPAPPVGDVPILKRGNIEGIARLIERLPG